MISKRPDVPTSLSGNERLPEHITDASSRSDTRVRVPLTGSENGHNLVVTAGEAARLTRMLEQLEPLRERWPVGSQRDRREVARWMTIHVKSNWT